MGCSDNVLRAGLTPKHIDTAELINCTQLAPFISQKLTANLINNERVLQPLETKFGLALCQAFESKQSINVASRYILLVAKGSVQINDTVINACQFLFIEPSIFQVSGDGLLVRDFES
ncbi:hypothetical protein HC729_17230 [Vibrio sp. S12_S33]|nr:hypothetical protein [Vibrio sp. S12_S33]